MLMEGLQTAGRDRELLGRLHEFNDWVQRTLIDLTAEIGSAFFRAPPRERPADPPPQPAAEEDRQAPEAEPGRKRRPKSSPRGRARSNPERAVRAASEAQSMCPTART